MKILANENIPLNSVQYLKSKGYDIKSIGLDNPSISDNEVIEIAIKEDRLIITFDRDYGELIYKYGYKPKAGVIYLRFKEFSPVFPGQLIHDILQLRELNFNNKLTVIDENGIRQRKF